VRIFCRLLVCTTLFGFAQSFADQVSPAIKWIPWSTGIFDQAKRENKFVILDLEAVWCHWCHVMDESTYRDPAVAMRMKTHFIAVRVDQDSRPDLSNRYEDYGWPATVIFAPDGTELVKRQGYIPPAEMVSLLQAVIDDPTPGPSSRIVPARGSGRKTTLGERQAATLQSWRDGYDHQAGGWGFRKKYLDWDNVELALHLATQNDPEASAMARETLQQQRKLVDPVWGGVYQYSVGGNWDEPHFEKIMEMQAENLRTYAQAYEQWGHPADLETARAIHQYVRSFLTSPEGAFYTSQDADLVPGKPSAEYFSWDDAGRRTRGVPRVDQHIYARENGWMIVALARLAEATKEPSYRDEAVTAATWILAHRGLSNGGFRHDERDTAGPFLGDSLAMGRAFLALYQMTANPVWLSRAESSGRFIRTHFTNPNFSGIASSDLLVPSLPTPLPQFDENVSVARFGLALARATGQTEFRQLAETALQWALSPEVIESRHSYVGALLLAEDELRNDPLHVMIVGGKDDPAARALFEVALQHPGSYKLVEWWDRREGPAPRAEAIYPELPQASAFVCANGACSAPIFEPTKLRTRLHLPSKAKAPELAGPLIDSGRPQ
jgi:uncharacterized protein YyaL (SSP411 family)